MTRKALPTPALLLLLIAFTGLITGCRKVRSCDQKDRNEGIIHSVPDITCLPEDGKQLLIDDDSSYRAHFPSGCDLPDIDFTTHTLLGLYASGTCDVAFTRNVTRIENEQRYHYSVKVSECGKCKSLGLSYNLVLVPKLPTGWTVTYEN